LRANREELNTAKVMLIGKKNSASLVHQASAELYLYQSFHQTNCTWPPVAAFEALSRPIEVKPKPTVGSTWHWEGGQK
jgi:hypothetical protein